MKRVRFHVSSAWEMENTMNSPLLTYKYPHFLPSSREVEWVRDQSWQDQKLPCYSSWIVGIQRCPNSEFILSLGKECSVFFSSRVDWGIASWAWGYKDNGTHPRSKKEWRWLCHLTTPAHSKNTKKLQNTTLYVSKRQSEILSNFPGFTVSQLRWAPNTRYQWPQLNGILGYHVLHTCSFLSNCCYHITEEPTRQNNLCHCLVTGNIRCKKLK